MRAKFVALSLLTLLLALPSGTTARAEHSHGHGDAGHVHHGPGPFYEMEDALEAMGHDLSAQTGCRHSHHHHGSAGRSDRGAVSYTSSTSRDFCNDPYNAVCGRRDAAETARDQRIAANKAQFWQIGLQRSSERYHFTPVTEEAMMALDFPTSYEAREHAVLEMMRASRQSAAGNTLERIRTEFTNARTLMAGNIEAMPGIESTMRAGMLAALQSIEFVDGASFLSSQEGREAFDVRCGSDGLSDNAFLSYANGVPKLVICPGFELALAEPTLPEPERLARLSSRLSFILGHEVGHSVDTYQFPTFYRPLLNCVNDNFRPHLTGPRLPEGAADFWSAQNLAATLRTMTDETQRIRLMRDGLEFLCGDEGDEAHPTGRFRIEAYMRHNPDIHSAMGCTTAGLRGRPLCGGAGVTQPPAARD